MRVMNTRRWMMLAGVLIVAGLGVFWWGTADR